MSKAPVTGPLQVEPFDQCVLDGELMHSTHRETHQLSWSRSTFVAGKQGEATESLQVTGPLKQALSPVPWWRIVCLQTQVA